LGEGYLPY